MYKTKSHAKQIDPSKFKKVTAEQIEEGRKKAVAKKEAEKEQKKKMDQSNWKKVTAEEVEAGRQKNLAAKANKDKVEKRPAVEIKTDSKQPELRNPEKEKKSTSYADAAKKDPKLNSYIKQRKGLKKGTPEYNAVQNKINAAYGKGPQRPTKTLDTSKKKSTIKSSVEYYNPAEEKRKEVAARNAKEKAANESKASKLAETKKTATTKIDKKKLKSQAGEGYKEALSDAKKKKASAKESLKQKASGEKALSYGDSDKNKKEIKKENVKLAKSSNKIDKKKIKSQAGEGAKEALADAKSKRRSEIREAKGKGPKRKEVKANNRASYAEAAKQMNNLDATLNDSPMLYAGMKMKKSKPMMKGKLCMKSFRSGRRG
tara:strand:+ start:617 stop:1735 length:1119 start_codon:yes stop_codon:yes gene_type:complete